MKKKNQKKQTKKVSKPIIHSSGYSFSASNVNGKMSASLSKTADGKIICMKDFSGKDAAKIIKNVMKNGLVKVTDSFNKIGSKDTFEKSILK